MNGERLPFSADERQFIDAERAKTPPTSYGTIAKELGRRFKEYNGGKRNRNSVYGYVNIGRRDEALIQVSIQKDLLARARQEGVDIRAAVEASLEYRLRRKAKAG